MNNSKLSNRLHAFPKTQKLSVDTKEKIEKVLEEEISSEMSFGNRKGLKGFLKKSMVPVAGVAAIFLFSLLLLSTENFHFNVGKENQLNGSGDDITKGLYREGEKATAEDKEKVIFVVEGFGKILKDVSLLAPEDIVRESIKENYGNFLTPRLLTTWMNDPKLALGRMVSSPWPDRINIIDVERTSVDTYEVTGTLIEVTNVEKESGGSAAERPVTLTLQKIEKNWLIDSAIVGDYVQDTGVQYENTDYNFIFSLPDSWEGYQIVTDKWEGTPINSDNSNGEQVNGPILIIRHPKWTSETPRQDIPIMIFTSSQWDALQQEEFHIGAAPIGPKELDHNDNYVFALPARYNFAFPEGYQEVEEIIAKDPLETKKSINKKGY